MVVARKKAVGAEYSFAHNPAPIKKEKQHSTKVRKPFWLFKVMPGVFGIALIFVIGLALVAQNAFLNNLGHEINKSKKEIAALNLANEKLALEVSALGSLNRIEDVAINQLGMVAPDDFKYVVSDFENVDDNYIQIAGFNALPISTYEVKEETTNTWLGMITEFINREKNSLE